MPTSKDIRIIGIQYIWYMKWTCFRPAGILLIVFILFSCKKESINRSPDASLRTSADSLKFDTVFTSVGSITQSFKIFNENNQKLLISSVKLMGGNTSAYRININGEPGPEARDLEVAANDSIYVFVSVTIDPNSNNLPFIVSDSIRIEYNGNERFVQLEAFGQNAHFLRNEVIGGQVTWSNDLPYVILGGLQVDTGATLQIDPGCRIYVHANAPVLVDGTLLVNGEKNREVQFTGDRLDEYYRDLPGSWPGIYFRGTSISNRIRFAVLKNAYQAIVCIDTSSNLQPKLILSQSIIQNASGAGIIGYRSSIHADNSLVANCGNNISLQWGGNYRFVHCTAASFSSSYIPHRNPVLSVLNYTTSGGTLQTADCQAIFQNCIFWGSEGLVDNEVTADKQGGNLFDVMMENCLYRANSDPSQVTLSNIIRNQDPLFDSIDVANKYYDFRTSRDPLAPGADQGMVTPFTRDLDDLPRNVVLPDLGCYERQ